MISYVTAHLTDVGKVNTDGVDNGVLVPPQYESGDGQTDVNNEQSGKL